MLTHKKKLKELNLNGFVINFQCHHRFDHSRMYSAVVRGAWNPPCFLLFRPCVAVDDSLLAAADFAFDFDLKFEIHGHRTREKIFHSSDFIVYRKLID